MNRIKFSLLFKITLAFSFLILLAVGTFSAFLIFYERFQFSSNLEDKAIFLSRNFARKIEAALTRHNPSDLKPILTGFLKDEDIIYGQVFDSNGKLLAYQEKTNKLQGGAFNLTLPLLQYSSLSNKNRELKVIGKFVTGISLERANLPFYNNLVFSLNFTLGLILLGAVMMVIAINYLLTSPLDKLITGIKKISTGDLLYKIKIKSHDEFGELAEAFNTMSAELKKNKEQIEGHAQELEDRISERTQELEMAKATLEEKVAERTAELKNERESLESKVKERTAELEAKIIELQEFSNAAIGRELKMIELEKEMEALRHQLGTEQTI